VSRRAEIVMSDAEFVAFITEQHTVTVASNGRDGWAHLMPLWYVVRDGELWVWTYASSQKVRNLERDPRATLSIEAGEEYADLRGVMLRTEAVIERDSALVTALGIELYERHAGSDGLPVDQLESIAKQAPKRVAIRFAERARVSWDHRKLARS